MSLQNKIDLARERDPRAGIAPLAGKAWIPALSRGAMLAPTLILFVLFIAYPLWNTLTLSLTDARLSSSARAFVGVANFRELFGDPVFWMSIKNNVIILVGSVVFQVGLGAILAAICHRAVRRRTSTVARTIIFIPILMSAAAVGLLWALIFNPSIGAVGPVLHFFNLPAPGEGFLGDPNLAIFAILFVACWQYTGFMMVMLFAGMQAIPVEIYEAATLDGASEPKILWNITLPGIRNVLMAAILITMIGSFKAFDTVFVLTNGGPYHASEVLGTYLYKEAFSLNRVGYASAIAVVLLLFSVILSIAQLRIQGRDDGASQNRGEAR